MSKKYVRPEKTPAYLSVTYPQGGDEPGHRTATLTIEDAISGAAIVELEIDLYQYALAQTALQSRPCKIEFWPQNFGKIAEHKDEIVPIPEGVSWDHRKHADEALAPFEVDGWRGDRSDFGNHHRGGTKGYRVRFSRHVEPTPEALAVRLKRFEEREELERRS